MIIRNKAGQIQWKVNTYTTIDGTDLVVWNESGVEWYRITLSEIGGIEP